MNLDSASLDHQFWPHHTPNICVFLMDLCVELSINKQKSYKNFRDQADPNVIHGKHQTISIIDTNDKVLIPTCLS